MYYQNFMLFTYVIALKAVYFIFQPFYANNSVEEVRIFTAGLLMEEKEINADSFLSTVLETLSLKILKLLILQALHSNLSTLNVSNETI